MGEQGKVRFIRVHGRVVPVRQKGGEKAQSMTGNRASQYMKATAKQDRKLSSTARKGALFSAGMSAVMGTGALLAKGRARKWLAGSAGLHLFLAGVQKSFGSGREMSANDREGYARKFKNGQTITAADQRGMGGASGRAYAQADFLQKLMQRKGAKK